MSAVASTPERRQTPSERLHELAMAYATRPTSPPESSCDLTRNAKGDVQVAVTVRGYDAAEVVAEARRLFDELCVAYPRQDAAGQGEAA